jgi:hypothetical protein
MGFEVTIELNTTADVNLKEHFENLPLMTSWCSKKLSDFREFWIRDTKLYLPFGEGFCKHHF